MAEIKKCPFRVDENGEFKECLGAECMAFYEYDAPVYTPPFPGQTCAVQNPAHLLGCLRMAPKPVPYCGI